MMKSDNVEINIKE